MTGFKSPEEFDAWQLAWELKERVVAFTATAPAVRDGEFCKEILKAARSAPDNIAEGFYRFNPTDFANFVRIALGSLGEVRNQLRHAHSSKYLTDAEYGDINRLCRRAMGASTGLRLYLLSLPKNFDPRKINPKRHAVAASEPGTRNPSVEPEPGT
jgi:four helix bundle protein